MSDKAVLREAIQFFREEPGLHRVLWRLIDKYRSLGRLGGKVTLTSLTDREKESLSALMRRDYSQNKSVTIAYEKFEQALQQTKFAGLDILSLLEGFAGEPLMTKVEEKLRYETQKKAFFEDLKLTCSHAICRDWLEHIQQKGEGSRGIHLAYDRDQKLLKQRLIHICQAVENRLEQKDYIRLPVFAAQITGDPHGFDIQTEQGRFLIHALQWVRQSERPMDMNDHRTYAYRSSPTSEEVTELFHFFGIIRDEILNFVTCSGILGFDEDEQPISVWQEAWQHDHVLNVPLREMLKVSSCTPAYVCDCPHVPKKVFVVENSGVFSAILDAFQSQPLPPLICTHGQFKLATLVMLDHLARQGTQIYYSGDFDVEGLQMAQRLKQRYPQHTRLWRYTVADYNRCASGRTLSETTRSQWASIDDPDLLPVKEEILQQRKTAYQEDLIAELVEDMQEIRIG